MPKEETFSFKNLFVPLTTKKIIVFIFLIGFVLFFNSLFNGFVLDDNGQILNNNSIHSLFNIIDIFMNHIHAREVDNYFRPLPIVFYTIIYSIFQENSFFFHLVQVLFHISNAVLIFLIFKKFLKQHIAFFIALIFLIHPINVEAVVYISGLQDVLFVFFGLLALYLLQNDSYKLKRIIFVNIFLLFSIFSKETGALFFVICFMYVYLFRKNKLLLHSVLSLVVGLIYLAARLMSNVPFRNIPVVPIMRLSLPERAMSIPAIIFYYIKTFFYPKNLAAAHAWTIRSIQINTFFMPLLFDVLFFLILFLICFLVIKKKYCIPGIFFIIWFILGLTIHLQLFPLDMTVADRFFYFPIIGLLALIGLFLNNLKFSRSDRYVSIGLAVVILTALAIRTFVRNTNWYSQTTIVTHDERVEKNDYLLELLMSTDLIQHGKFTEALPYARKAVALYPQSWIAWGNVGLVYQSQNDYRHAKQAYLQSLSIANYYLAYENLALLLLNNETLTTARNFIIKANNLYPNSEKLWYYRIITSYKLGDNLDAIYAAKQYYILRQDQESYTILYYLQRNIPINITE